MDFIEYRTKEGQRWDTVAYEAYGDAFGYERILRANPEYLGLAVLPGGLVLRVPVIEQKQVKVELGDLPPWRR